MGHSKPGYLCWGRRNMRVVFPLCKARIQIKGYDLQGVVLDVASFSDNQRRIFNRVTRVENPLDLQLIYIVFAYYRLRAVPVVNLL
jgi:hypothetical protein